MRRNPRTIVVILSLAALVALLVGMNCSNRHRDRPADDRSGVVTIVPGPPGVARAAEPVPIDEPPAAAPDADRSQADPSVEAQLQRDIEDDIVASQQRAQERARSAPVP